MRRSWAQPSRVATAVFPEPGGPPIQSTWSKLVVADQLAGAVEIRRADEDLSLTSAGPVEISRAEVRDLGVRVDPLGREQPRDHLRVELGLNDRQPDELIAHGCPAKSPSAPRSSSAACRSTSRDPPRAGRSPPLRRKRSRRAG